MKQSYKQPEFSLIRAANTGSMISIYFLLNHYDAYIKKCSLRPLYEECGAMYMAVDEELKGTIQIALIKMILKFRMEIVWTIKYARQLTERLAVLCALL